MSAVVFRFGTWPTGTFESSLRDAMSTTDTEFDPGVRHVDAAAVGRERQPVGVVADRHAAQQLQVRHRIRVDRVIDLAADPQRLAVRRDADAVRRRALQHVPVLLRRFGNSGSVTRPISLCVAKSTM